MEEIDLMFKTSDGQVKVIWRPKCITKFKNGEISWEQLRKEIQKIKDLACLKMIEAGKEDYGFYPRHIKRKYVFIKPILE